MRYHTKRYDIRRVDGEDFNEGIKYEINLKDGYQFSDGSHLNYASDTVSLMELINDIKAEQPEQENKTIKKETAYKTPYGYFYNGKAIVRKIDRRNKVVIHWFVDEKKFDALKKAKQYIDTIKK